MYFPSVLHVVFRDGTVAHTCCALRIDTQDVLIKEHDIERFVEIGPSDTLLGITNKTIAGKYNIQDIARGKDRQLQSYEKDAKEIRYEVDEVVPEPVKAVEAPKAAPVAAPVAVAAPVQAAVANKVADIPASAKELVLSIISQKLRKGFREVEVSQTIKQLVGGKISCPYARPPALPY